MTPQHKMSEEDLAKLRASLEAMQLMAQQDSSAVRSLRESGAACDQAELQAAEKKVKETFKQLGVLQRQLATVDGSEEKKNKFRRVEVETLLKRRFFIAQSFEIYGGIAGLYDYGPPGCAVKNHIIQAWRQHFVIEESMLELEATCLTPEPVLKASGHVDKFTDLLVKDSLTGDAYRADHLLENYLDKVLDDASVDAPTKDKAAALRAQADDLVEAEMDAALAEWKVKAPVTGNDLTQAKPFNLMFGTFIGPTGQVRGYLRPETAQGIFVNFKRLLEYQGGKLPFACAQIGLSFRNEISPKAGLLRVREFCQAEIEHFVHPKHKGHPKINTVREVSATLYPKDAQISTYKTVRMTIGQAIDKNIVANETLAYFIARTAMFCESIGLQTEHVRFRQHKENEMAHYACDCWDLEVETSYGWIECAGLADRSAFDLSNHTEKSSAELTAREVYDEVKMVEEWVVKPVKGIMGKQFKKDAQIVMATLESLPQDDVVALQANLAKGPTALQTSDGKSFEVTPEMMTFAKETKKVTGENYFPSVIEPSFGIGRLIYCLFEHSYYCRAEPEGQPESTKEQRHVLRLPALVAPVKCVILPLSKSEQFEPMIRTVSSLLSTAGLINKIDDGGASIGKRYSRADEIGAPFGITVDFESLVDDSVTLRERDSLVQVRGPVQDIADAVAKLSRGTLTWEEVTQKFPAFDSAE